MDAQEYFIQHTGGSCNVAAAESSAVEHRPFTYGQAFRFLPLPLSQDIFTAGFSDFLKPVLEREFFLCDKGLASILLLF